MSVLRGNSSLLALRKQGAILGRATEQRTLANSQQETEALNLSATGK